MKSSVKNIAVALSVAVVALTALDSAHAELVATPLKGDVRLVQFNYDIDNTYLVLTKPKAVTHLAFAADETIQSVAAGDTATWDITATKDRKNLFIKPTYDDSDTSMTVLTTKRTYQFVLRSTSDGKKWYQRVTWLYPKDLVMEMAGQADMSIEAPTPRPFAATSQQPATTHDGSSDDSTCTGTLTRLNAANLDMSFESTGDAPFKPTVVMSDGKFTYIRMPQSIQELPALFTVIDGNEYSLVNYTVDCNYLVAQRVLDTAVLKIGKQEVRINHVKPKKSLFGFGG